MCSWVHQARRDAGKGDSEALTSTEREKLIRLRRENKVLRRDRDILRSATVFFAKEGLS